VAPPTTVPHYLFNELKLNFPSKTSGDHSNDLLSTISNDLLSTIFLPDIYLLKPFIPNLGARFGLFSQNPNP
jgi:hypothetical protein